MNKIEDKIKQILEEEIQSSSNILSDIEQLEELIGKKVVLENKDKTKEEVLDAEKVRFINDTRSRSIPEGKIEDFLKICNGDPRELSSKELDAKFKKALKWAAENLDQKVGIANKSEKLETKKENTMSDNKKVITEAEKGNPVVDKAFNILTVAANNLSAVKISLKSDLNAKVAQLANTAKEGDENPNANLTAILQNINNAIDGLETLVPKLRKLLDM